MGCCTSNVKNLKPIKKGSVLWTAQHIRVTRSGHPITSLPPKTMTQKEADKISHDPNAPIDYHVVFNPPLSVSTKLTPYVYLSSIASLTRENLTNLGINLIINATYEWPLVDMEGITCYRVPVDDAEGDDITMYLDEVADLIEDNTQDRGKTLVHCMAGASRSTTLVLAYLIKYEKMSLKNAFKSVRKRRETARPNIGFWEQLIRYEIRTRSLASVQMSNLTIDGIKVKVPDFYEKEFPELFKRETEKQINFIKDKQINPNVKTKAQKHFNPQTNAYE